MWDFVFCDFFLHSVPLTLIILECLFLRLNLEIDVAGCSVINGVLCRIDSELDVSI